MRDDFCVFILTHGRSDILKTNVALFNANYSGKIIYVVDNEDETADKYIEKFGKENVYVFDKKKVAEKSDPMDLVPNRMSILYARNVTYDIAKELGYTYFLQLDDDYVGFRGRRWRNNKFISIYLKDFDGVVDAMVEFLETSGADVVAMSQIGDFIGGVESKLWTDKIRRKAMNTLFCKTSRKVEFKGRLNDDVNSYIWNGSRGKLFFTVRDISVDQLPTQKLKGGLSGVYDDGTYTKTFYSVMICPSSVKVYTMGDSKTNKHHRIHHVIDWNSTVPKIISGIYKKEDKENENQNRAVEGTGIESINRCRQQ